MLDYMDEVLELQHLGRLPIVFLPCEKYCKMPKYWDTQNNKISICSKCKIDYFLVSQNLGTLQPNYNVLKYWNT